MSRHTTFRLTYLFLGLAAIAVVGTGSWFGYQRWRSSGEKDGLESAQKPAVPIVDGTMPVRLTPQARKNLGLESKPSALTTYWRKIDVPAVVAHRPGISERGVVAPVAGVVTQIHAQVGATAAPDSPLFTIRLVSDELHAAQRELYKASEEIEITRQKRQRLAGLVQENALPPVRLVEIDNDIRRLEATVKAYDQDLQSRGLSAEQIAAISRGDFVKEIVVTAPGERELDQAVAATLTAAEGAETKDDSFRYELSVLKVELGQQVAAGELLCSLADHRELLLEGRGFKDDLPLIQRAAESESPVEIELEHSASDRWPEPPQDLHIQHVANTIDPETRTFGFFIPLHNRWEVYTRDGQSRLLWQFRPGDRMRVRVSVEQLTDVFVLPRDAVVREGPEAYVFRQNGDLFDRLPVHVLAEDRTSVVIANDGSVRPRSYLAQNSAASLNRVLKSQMASGQPTNIHVHADGTTHAAH